MSKSLYQIQVENGSLGQDIHLVKPIVNEKYFIIPKEQALKELSNWRDITKTTNERRYPFYKKVNTQILSRVYGGYGTTDYSVDANPPGTEAYFNTQFDADDPNSKPSVIRANLINKPVNAELQEFEEEANELRRQRDIAEETGTPEISKILKDQALGGDSTGIEIGTPLNTTEETVTTLPVSDNITTETPDEGTKVPPIIINHAECGHLTFGDEKKNSQRPRDVGLYGGDSNSLRLFRDGGFDLRSSESQGANLQKGSLINQVCDDAPLSINSEGDIIIRAKNKIILEADLVEIEATNKSEDGVTIMAEHDIKLRAENNTIITSDNITIDAHERIVSHSEGWTVLIGQYIRLHEPQTKICPAFLEEYIDNQIKTLKD